MLSRVMLALSVLALSVSIVAAATVCGDSCYATNLLMAGQSASSNVIVQVYFMADASGNICGLSTNGQQSSISDTTGSPELFYAINSISGSVTLSGTGPNFLISRFGQLTGPGASTVTFTTAASGSTSAQSGTLVGSTGLSTGGGTLALNSFTGVLYVNPPGTINNQPSVKASVPLPFAGQDSCNAGGGGDPFFSGFQGQQFFVAGEVGGVMNILSSFNLELNSRIIFLDNGDALMPAEQERLFLLSQIRNAADPSVPVLDHTTYWSHPGNYFGEAGVAMIDGHRLYAKPGSYKDGWATVTLDDKPLVVSDEYIVLGSGVNAITIARPSTHRIVFRTLNVEFSLLNSDNFFNVEQAHLEKGWHKHAHFDGVMGRTAKPGFQWNPEMEKEVMVQSGDLFEFVAQPL